MCGETRSCTGLQRDCNSPKRVGGILGLPGARHIGFELALSAVRSRVDAYGGKKSIEKQGISHGA
jgi:hypothetical protein